MALMMWSEGNMSEETSVESQILILLTMGSCTFNNKSRITDFLKILYI